MDAAEPAGAHEPDPGRTAGRQRAADGRRADGVLDDCGSQVARAHLAGVGREAAQLLLGQADAQPAVEDADRGGDGARVAHAPLALEAHRDALAGREAVGDERRLERDHGLPVRKRVCDLVRDPDQISHGIEPSFATHRAAAARASSGPPTR